MGSEMCIRDRENNQSCYFALTIGSETSNPSNESSISLINFPVCSAAVVDHNNDGYGWENNQSCTIPDQTSPTDQPPLVLVSFPACSSPLVDHDGDGYGWENNQTCMIVPSGVDDNSIAGASITGVIHRICSVNAVDDNNDGFAWENNATCVIASSVPTLLQSGEFPDCSSALVDENLDGYGWENNQSCRFVN